MASISDKGTDAHSESIALWTRRCLVVFTALGCIALAGIAFWLLGQISGALILFILSALLAYIISPLVRYANRIMPLPLAILLVYVVVFSALIFFCYFIIWTAVGQLISFVGNAQQALPQLQQFITPILQRLNGFNISPGQLEGAAQQILNNLLNVVGQIQPLLINLFTLFIDLILVVTLSIYFLIYGPKIIGWFRTDTPQRGRRQIALFLEALDHTMGGFVRGQLILAAVMSALVGGTLFFLGVPYAVLLALVVFVFEFIPQIGAYISGAIVIAITFATKGWQVGLIVLVISSLLQGVVDGQILAPRIIGQAVGLNPIVSIFALLAGAQLFGLFGAFFSAPIAGIIQVFVLSSWKLWKTEHPEEFSDSKKIEKPEDRQQLPQASTQQKL